MGKPQNRRSPVLSSAIVARDCRVTEVKVVGTHNVIFGVVQAVAIKTTEPALVYQGRSYKSL